MQLMHTYMYVYQSGCSFCMIMLINCDVKLMGNWASPFSQRIQYGLNLKPVEYEFIVETFNPISNLLLESNPVHKQIPVLFHDDKTICESLVILEYIHEVWSTTSPSILPSHPHDRSIARFWANYVDSKVFPLLDVTVKAQKEEKLKVALMEIKEVFLVLEEAFVKLSKGKGFFGGDHIGYVDIALGCFLGWLKVSEEVNQIKIINEEITPNLFEWAARFYSDDIVKNVMPPHAQLLEFAIKFFIPKFSSITT